MNKINRPGDGSNRQRELYYSVFGRPALPYPSRRDRFGELIEPDDPPVRQAPKDPRKRLAYVTAYQLALLNSDYSDSLRAGLDDALEDAAALRREGVQI